MIEIEKMTSLHLGRVNTLSVESDQLQYVATIDDILASANAQIRPHVIIANDEVVGFFLIDTAYADHNDCVESNSLGLRSFFIDHKHQGNGYAKQTLQILPTYLMSNFPKQTNVYLTVNCKNKLAQKSYLNAGFYDTGNLYHGGKSGPQHIMCMDLNLV
ncbi:acetyltransferase [Marinomonas ushuaiensis DSM 15871]|uniref:Acetyltransferase n=1 Tax=Marinomonas ushuaiensis DSM 15871 TaxID=1122207 RepID=X7E4I1_9GAMM|nr:GNAT family N-acetyltransferase [Marinomonas ushuaiensis]ETX10076.1 acetyltransferase [Marinomonas ushuaiensis DSM 15871]